MKDLIQKLEDDVEAEATQKGFCANEMADAVRSGTCSRVYVMFVSLLYTCACMSHGLCCILMLSFCA